MILSLVTIFALMQCFVSTLDAPDKEAHQDFVNKTGEY